MPSTPHGFRYPASTDIPDGAGQIAALAADVDTKAWPPEALHAGARPAFASFAAASAEPGYAIVTDANTDGPWPGNYMVSESVHWYAATQFRTQYAHSFAPIGGPPGVTDVRRWMRQSADGAVWSPWRLVSAPALYTADLSMPAWTAGAVGTLDVTFPAGRFSSTPAIVVSPIASTAGVSVSVSAQTAAGCTVKIVRLDGAAQAAGVHVHMIAMLTGYGFGAFQLDEEEE